MSSFEADIIEGLVEYCLLSYIGHRRLNQCEIIKILISEFRAFRCNASWYFRIAITGGAALGTLQSQREGLFSSSWRSLNCRKNSPLQESQDDDPSSTNSHPQESKKRSWITPSKWGLGLGFSVPDMWPVNSCKMGPQTQNLKTIITTPSSWRWFHSSNSMLKDFLEDTEILKNMDTKDLNEYRELLLDEPLTFDRLQHYPKLVLRVFVFLLRNQEPPRNLKKKVLIELCTRWRCKNKNYFCLLENDVNTILQSEHMVNHLPAGNMLSRLRLLRPMRSRSSRGRNEDGNLDAYALGGFAASSVYKDIVRPSTSETAKIKLHEVSRFFLYASLPTCFIPTSSRWVVEPPPPFPPFSQIPINIVGGVTSLEVNLTSYLFLYIYM